MDIEKENDEISQKQQNIPLSQKHKNEEKSYLFFDKIRLYQTHILPNFSALAQQNQYNGITLQIIQNFFSIFNYKIDQEISQKNGEIILYKMVQNNTEKQNFCIETYLDIKRDFLQLKLIAFSILNIQQMTDQIFYIIQQVQNKFPSISIQLEQKKGIIFSTSVLGNLDENVIMWLLISIDRLIIVSINIYELLNQINTKKFKQPEKTIIQFLNKVKQDLKSYRFDVDNFDFMIKN